MTERKQRMTVTLDHALVRAGAAAVAEGRAASLSAWVSSALTERAAGDEQHALGLVGIVAREAVGELDAVHAWHGQVAEDEREALAGGEAGQRRQPVLGHDQAEAVAEGAGDRGADHRVVVDDQDRAARLGRHRRGRRR